jgi:hypothetical protein
MKGPRLRKLMLSTPGGKERVGLLYMEILSRPPAPQEQQIAMDYLVAPGGGSEAGFYDLAWALINTSEFILKH